MAIQFLPYQADWINDKSRFKIAEKSRRAGFTYAQSYEDVEYCLDVPGRKVYFSSRDDTAALEYIEYCVFFLKNVYGAAAEFVGLELIDKKKDLKAHAIRMKNGSKILATTSSPDMFRSKGGKVVLDEFAFHKDQEKLYKAAYPVILRNDPLRILSTYNGRSNLYYKLIQQIKAGKKPSWSLHTVDIYKAIDQGLYDNIMGEKTTEAEREAWVKEIMDNSLRHEDFLEEFCCIPCDPASSWLPYELMAPCEVLPERLLWL